MAILHKTMLVHLIPRIIILYAVPISLWPTLGKENRYFYTRHPNTNDRCLIRTFYNLIFS